MTFKPIIGTTTSSLLAKQTKLTKEELLRLQDESIDILSKCSPPGAQNPKAGLIVGYVQSGKTLSLTTVSSLARDNGYGMIIVLCGVTNILFNQSSERLVKDLVDMPKRLFSCIAKPPYKSDAISSTLSQWSTDKERSPAMIICVLKNGKRIRDLTAAISKSRSSIHKSVPTLIIDDEAHMAGLNTKAKKDDESEVYSAIKALRESIPDHTYLQYTATPMAPLLVQIADTVSPDFAKTLTPGEAYLGGKDVFSDENSPSFIRHIPQADIIDAKEPNESAPQSLDSALLTFLVGLADGIIKGESEDTTKTRTMLVHPGFKQDTHHIFGGYIKSLLDSYETILGPYGESTAREDLTARINKVYLDVKSTYPKLSSIENIIHRFKDAVTKSNGSIQKLHQGQDNRVEWKDYAHILIGGEVLGVGFTVEGLTVTYMPREAAGGQADSMQQRARFLGYRSQYAGLCRIFITEDDHDLYATYSVGEEEMRKQLVEMNAANKTLKQWKRQFLMHANLRLTRANIQTLETESRKLDEQSYPSAPFECNSEKNQRIFSDIHSKYVFQVDKKWNQAWGLNQKHKYVVITIEDALELISKFEWKKEEDVRDWSTFFLILKTLHLSSKAGDSCKLMIMSPDVTRRQREIKNGKWSSKFQGSNNKTNPLGYPGDIETADPEQLTIQIYDFEMYGDEEKFNHSSVIVPVIIPTVEMLNELQLVREPKKSN